MRNPARKRKSTAKKTATKKRAAKKAKKAESTIKRSKACGVCAQQAGLKKAQLARAASRQARMMESVVGYGFEGSYPAPYTENPRKRVARKRWRLSAPGKRTVTFTGTKAQAYARARKLACSQHRVCLDGPH